LDERLHQLSNEAVVYNLRATSLWKSLAMSFFCNISFAIAVGLFLLAKLMAGFLQNLGQTT